MSRRHFLHERVVAGLQAWLREYERVGAEVELPTDFLCGRSTWAQAVKFLDGALGTYCARRYRELGYEHAEDMADNFQWYHDEWETIVKEALWNMGR